MTPQNAESFKEVATNMLRPLRPDTPYPFLSEEQWAVIRKYNSRMPAVTAVQRDFWEQFVHELLAATKLP